MSRILTNSLIVLSLFTICLPSFAAAITPQADLEAIRLNSTFYDPGAVTVNSCSNSSGNIAAGVNLPKSIIDELNANKSIYEEVGNAKDFPWQVLAAIHYRETNLSKTNPGNGNGLYQVVGTSYPAGPVSTDQFKAQTEAAVDFFLAKQGSNLPNHQQKISLKHTDADTIKDTFFSYNGRAQVYADSATQYGFSASTQPYEGSPYVMNKFDAARQSMGIITHDNGGVDGRDSRYGAFTIYAALAGVSSTGNGCSSAASGSIAAIALQEFSKNVVEVPDGSNSSPEIDKYTDNHPEFWCADFVSWVYKEAGKSFTGGVSGGWRISYVPTLREWLQTNGKYTKREDNGFMPQPGDVVILAGDASSTDSNGAEGHTGIIYQVNDKTIVTIEGNSSNMVAKRTYNNYLSNNSVTGWGRK